MKTYIFEAVNCSENDTANWGKFLVGIPDKSEWGHRSLVDTGTKRPLLSVVGTRLDHFWLLDLQAGEGIMVDPSRFSGSAREQLHKHRVYVCLLFEPFLKWLLQQDLEKIEELPRLVRFSYDEAPADMAGYRRPGPHPS